MSVFLFFGPWVSSPQLDWALVHLNFFTFTASPCIHTGWGYSQQYSCCCSRLCLLIVLFKWNITLMPHWKIQYAYCIINTKHVTNALFWLYTIENINCKSSPSSNIGWSCIIDALIHLHQSQKVCCWKHILPLKGHSGGMYSREAWKQSTELSTTKMQYVFITV